MPTGFHTTQLCIEGFFMPIDPFKDDLFSLTQITRSLPKRPSPACMWRWYRKGINGVLLETVVVGGRRFTTKVAWTEFVRRTTAAANQLPPEEDDAPKRTESTQRKLKNAGLLNTEPAEGERKGCQT